MASAAATKVMQCTHIRELLQSYSDFAENSHFPDTCYLRGGWRLAHLSKLHDYDRSKLIGKVHEYSIDDFVAYLQLRIAYLLSAKGSDLDKLTVDFPVIVKHLHAWTVAQSEVLPKSTDFFGDWKQLELLRQLVEQILFTREGMLRSLFPGGLVDRTVRATQSSRDLMQSDLNMMHSLYDRIAENINRRIVENQLEALKQATDETLAYIAEKRSEHNENMRPFFTAAVAKVQQQQEVVSKDPPPAPLPGTNVSTSYNWHSRIKAVKKAIQRVEHVKRQVRN